MDVPKHFLWVDKKRRERKTNVYPFRVKQSKRPFCCHRLLPKITKSVPTTSEHHRNQRLHVSIILSNVILVDCSQIKDGFQIASADPTCCCDGFTINKTVQHTTVQVPGYGLKFVSKKLQIRTKGDLQICLELHTSFAIHKYKFPICNLCVGFYKYMCICKYIIFHL